MMLLFCSIDVGTLFAFLSPKEFSNSICLNIVSLYSIFSQY